MMTDSVSMNTVVDTIVYNKEAIARWQSDPSYDYNRGFVDSGGSFWDWIVNWFFKHVVPVYHWGSSSDNIYFWIGIVIIVVVLVVIWYAWRSHRWFLSNLRKGRQNYIVENETIYGIDFKKEIERAIDNSNFKEVIRLLYMQTLSTLNDQSRIEWEPWKTSRQYVKEMSDDSFDTLTRVYLKVRYGNFEADYSLYNDMRMMQNHIVGMQSKGGIR